jgi:betaine lipid synthase
VPCKQYRLIHKDGLRISSYVARTFDGVARNSHLRCDNYFYYNCLRGCFAPDNCPSYLIKENFTALKSGLIDNLTIVTSTFMDALTSRIYTKVRMLLWS